MIDGVYFTSKIEVDYDGPFSVLAGASSTSLLPAQLLPRQQLADSWLLTLLFQAFARLGSERACSRLMRRRSSQWIGRCRRKESCLYRLCLLPLYITVSRMRRQRCNHFHLHRKRSPSRQSVESQSVSLRFPRYQRLKR